MSTNLTIPFEGLSTTSSASPENREVCSQPDCGGIPTKRGLCRTHVAKLTWAKPDVRKKRTDASRKSRAKPEVRQKISASMKAAWSKPEVRKKITDGLARPEVRARLSDASKARWDVARDKILKAQAEGRAKPGVREKTNEAIRKAAADPTKGQTRSKSLQKFYADHPEAKERLVAHGQRNRENPVILGLMIKSLQKNAANPEVQKLMIEGRKRWWADHPKEREQRGKDIKAGWAKRNAKLAEAWRPSDWSKKPIIWRIIATELLGEPALRNKILGKKLLKLNDNVPFRTF